MFFYTKCPSSLSLFCGKEGGEIPKRLSLGVYGRNLIIIWLIGIECSCPFKGEAWGLSAGGVQQTSVEKVAIEICVEAKEVVEGSYGKN